MVHLKNYRSGMGIERIFDVIRRSLVEHRAKQIIFEYADDGRVKALVFSLDIAGTLHGFQMPARVERVEKLLYPHGDMTPSQKEQAYRTAWANIRDWITAQMALIDTQMVKPEEVFLPYMVTRDGKTYFETLEANQFLLEG